MSEEGSEYSWEYIFEEEEEESENEKGKPAFVKETVGYRFNM